MPIKRDIALAAILTLVAGSAYARDVKISGTHNVSDIEMHCIDNGGTFFNTTKGGYGCAGSGGGTVTCTSKGKCTGTVSRATGGNGSNGGKGVVSHPVNIIAPNKPTSFGQNQPASNNAKMGAMGGTANGGGGGGKHAH